VCVSALEILKAFEVRALLCPIVGTTSGSEAGGEEVLTLCWLLYVLLEIVMALCNGALLFRRSFMLLLELHKSPAGVPF
jgi:hypothetical protein